MAQLFTGLSPQEYMTPLSAYVEGRKARQDLQLGRNRVKLSDLTTKWAEEDRPYEVERMKREKTLGDQNVTIGGYGVQQAGREEEISATTFGKQKELAIKMLDSKLKQLDTDERKDALNILGDVSNSLTQFTPYFQGAEQFNTFARKMNNMIGQYTDLPLLQEFTGDDKDFPGYLANVNKLNAELSTRYGWDKKMLDDRTSAEKSLIETRGQESQETAAMRGETSQTSRPLSERDAYSVADKQYQAEHTTGGVPNADAPPYAEFIARRVRELLTGKIKVGGGGGGQSSYDYNTYFGQ